MFEDDVVRSMPESLVVVLGALTVRGEVRSAVPPFRVRGRDAREAGFLEVRVCALGKNLLAVAERDMMGSPLFDKPVGAASPSSSLAKTASEGRTCTDLARWPCCRVDGLIKS